MLVVGPEVHEVELPALLQFGVRQCTGQRFKYTYPETVYIRLLIAPKIIQLDEVGSHVHQCSTKSPQGGFAVRLARNPEVNQLRFPLVNDEDVGRLDIPVDNPLLLGKLETFNALVKDVPYMVPCKADLCPGLLNCLPQCHPIEILHDDTGAFLEAVIQKVVENTDNILVLETAGKRGMTIEVVIFHDHALERDQLARLKGFRRVAYIAGFIDRTLRPPVNLLENLILPDAMLAGFFHRLPLAGHRG